MANVVDAICSNYKNVIRQIDRERAEAIKVYEKRMRLIQDIEYLSGMSLEQIRDSFAAGCRLITPEALTCVEAMAELVKEMEERGDKNLEHDGAT